MDDVFELNQDRSVLSVLMATAMTMGFCSVLLMDVNTPATFTTVTPSRVVEHVVVEPPKPKSTSFSSSTSEKVSSIQPMPSAPSVHIKSMGSLALPSLSLTHELSWDKYTELSDDRGFELEKNIDMGQLMSSEFSFEQLDQKPKFLSTRPYEFPRDLMRKGIREGVVKVEIEIDTQGRARKLKVLESSHPRLNAVALQLMKMATYTIPTHKGKAVLAKDTWELTLRSPK